jgi:prolipoprotein diacylglyceryltransferase
VEHFIGRNGHRAGRLYSAVPASLRGSWKQEFTLTVGGAVFGGLLISPWIVHLLNMQAGTFLGYNVPVLPTMAAMAIAYGVGEGTGRLACISFGCCYGKSVNDLPSGLRKLLSPIGMTFSGKTKKIAYAHSLDGHAVVPIQAMTAIVYSATSLYGSWLFLNRLSRSLYNRHRDIPGMANPFRVSPGRLPRE